MAADEKTAAAIASVIAFHQSANAAETASAVRPVHATAMRFCLDWRLMLHGGYALNAALPDSLRPYPADDHAVHDIDAITHKDSKMISASAVTALRRAGHTVSMRPARHDNTWTIRSAGSVVLDVNGVSAEDMAALRALSDEEGSPRWEGIRVAPTAYLKASMHLELSRPTVYVERWAKVVPRLASIYSVHPVLAAPPAPRAHAANPRRRRRGKEQKPASQPPASQPGPPPPAQRPAFDSAAEAAAALLASGAPNATRLVIAGSLAALEMAGPDASQSMIRMRDAAEAHGPWHRLDVVTRSDAGATAACLAKELLASRNRRVVAREHPARMFLPHHVSLVCCATGACLCRVYSMPEPVCANLVPGVAVPLASADVVLYLLIGEYIASHDEHSTRAAVAEVANAVAAASGVAAEAISAATPALSVALSVVALPPADSPLRRLFLPTPAV